MQLSIRNRMLLYIVTPIVIIYIFSAGYNLTQFNSITTNNIKEKMSLLASVYANKFNGKLREVAMVAETTAEFVEHNPKLTEKELYTILRGNVLQSKLIYGGVISFEPFSYNAKKSLFCPYVYRGKEGVNKDTLKLVDLASTGFDYTQARWEWWHVPKNTSKPIWTEPYFDDGAGEILMSTYATAFNKGNKFYGVTTVDIPLESLRDKLQLGNDKNIRFSVLTKKGTFVFNSNKKLINNSIYEEAEKQNNSNLKNHADTILSNTKGFFKVKQWNGRSDQWLFYNTIESSGWTLIINVDEDYIFSEFYQKITWDAVISFLLFIILLVLIFYISEHLSRPIVELTDIAEKMITDNPNKNDSGKHDEVGYLKNIFISMRQSIDEKILTIQMKNSDLLISKESLEEKVKERTRELDSSEQHLKLYREQAPMASIEWNVDFQVIDWNKKAEEMFGYTVDEVKGRDFVDVMLPDSAIVDVKKIWKDLMAQTGGNISVNENLTKDGRIILCEWHNTPLIDESGNVIGAASIIQDITNRTELENQLNRTQKMNALGKLTGGIAHDYNNMLGVILGYTELLEENLQNNPELNSYLQEIHHAADRGTKLTTKLLSFTRNKSSNEEFLIINTLLQYQKDMLKKTLTARIKLHYEFDDELWPVLLDSSELEDVIINLSINAMHAIDSNGDLTIITKNVVLKEAKAQSLGLVAGDYVQMSFTDTGCGMDEATKSKIFDPFYSTKGDKGTGLGLSQVYGFVQRSKGGISVISELGKGTELCLYFPRNNISTSSIQLEIKEPYDNLNGNEVILVVDDEEALRRLISVILTEHGYKVICANNGKQALEILEKESVDLLLSDVIMPEIDGFQLAKVVHEKYSAIKIQLVSGFTDNRENEYKKEKDTWYNEVLHKPIHAKTLLLRIRELFDSSQ